MKKHKFENPKSRWSWEWQNIMILIGEKRTTLVECIANWFILGDGKKFYCDRLYTIRKKCVSKLKN